MVFTEHPVWVGLRSYQIMYKVSVENEIPSTVGLDKMALLCKSSFNDKSRRPTSAQVLSKLLSFKY